MKIFLIGIKGSGMSSLAQILNDLGHDVSGSDIEQYCFTQKKLEEKKISIYKFNEITNHEQYDEVIIGNAFNLEHVDAQKFKEKNIKITTYYNKLNELLQNKESIAIAGTNGKTTTTGLMVSSLNNQNPNYLIGDGEGNGNLNSDIFIFEACEYKNTFWNYNQKFALINNIELDHPDFFKSIEQMIESFQKFADNSQILIINGDDENCQKIEHNKKYTFGINENNDLQANQIKYTANGIIVNLNYNNQNIGEYLLPFFGEHMLYNSLATILTNLLLGIDIDTIIKNISQFQGVNRRFTETIINEEDNIVLIDDYAHHPTAINLTLEAVKQKYPKHKIIVVFQPHTFSRTEAFLEEFSECFSLADDTVLVDIFGSARESQGTITIDDLKNKVIEKNKTTLIEIEEINKYQKNSVICMLGAGNIDVLYKEKILNLLQK